MQAVRTLPKEFEKALGEAGAQKFVVFLNEAFEDQKNDTIRNVTIGFEKHVTEEVSKVRLEVASLRTELKTDISELRTELKMDIGLLDNKISAFRADMAELRTELKSDIGHLDNKISSLRAEIKSDIAAQTQWILIALLGGAVIYPISIKLIDRIFPAPAPTIQIQAPQQP